MKPIKSLDILLIPLIILASAFGIICLGYDIFYNWVPFIKNLFN